MLDYQVLQNMSGDRLSWIKIPQYCMSGDRVSWLYQDLYLVSDDRLSWTDQNLIVLGGGLSMSGSSSVMISATVEFVIYLHWHSCHNH